MASSNLFKLFNEIPNNYINSQPLIKYALANCGFNYNALSNIIMASSNLSKSINTLPNNYINYSPLFEYASTNCGFICNA